MTPQEKLWHLIEISKKKSQMKLIKEKDERIETIERELFNKDKELQSFTSQHLSEVRSLEYNSKQIEFSLIKKYDLQIEEMKNQYSSRIQQLEGRVEELVSGEQTLLQRARELEKEKETIRGEFVLEQSKHLDTQTTLNNVQTQLKSVQNIVTRVYYDSIKKKEREKEKEQQQTIHNDQNTKNLKRSISKGVGTSELLTEEEGVGDLGKETRDEDHHEKNTPHNSNNTNNVNKKRKGKASTSGGKNSDENSSNSGDSDSLAEDLLNGLSGDEEEASTTQIEANILSIQSIEQILKETQQHGTNPSLLPLSIYMYRNPSIHHERSTPLLISFPPSISFT